MPKKVPVQSPEQKLRSDPNFRSGIKKINSDDFRRLAGSLELDFAHAIAFHNLSEHATALKSEANELPQANEKQLARSAREALRASQHAVATMKKMNRMLASAGLDKVVEKHAAAVFRDYQQAPSILAGVKKLARLGLHDDALRCARRDLAKARFNPLRLEGSNGTLDGLVSVAEAALPRFSDFVQLVGTHGLPIAVGGDNNTGTTVILVIIVVGTLIVLGAIFY
jgi:hypothetical protein